MVKLKGISVPTLASFPLIHDGMRGIAYLVFARFPFPSQDLVDVGSWWGILHVRHVRYEGRRRVRLRLWLLRIVIHFHNVKVEDGSVTLTRSRVDSPSAGRSFVLRLVTGMGGLADSLFKHFECRTWCSLRHLHNDWEVRVGTDRQVRYFQHP